MLIIIISYGRQNELKDSKSRKIKPGDTKDQSIRTNKMKMTKLKRKKEKKSTHSVLKSCNICNDYLNYINILFICITIVYTCSISNKGTNPFTVSSEIVHCPNVIATTRHRIQIVKPEQTYTKEDSSITCASILHGAWLYVRICIWIYYGSIFHWYCIHFPRNADKHICNE